jgi:diguanylate cyclase (GGDEF)-like protein
VTGSSSRPAASPLDSCPEAVISTDAEGGIVRWNGASTTLLGVPATDVAGLPLASVLTLSPRDASGVFPERQWAVCGPVRVPVEVITWTADDEGQPITHLLLRDSANRVAVETESDRASAVLRRQARFDALTGLANRYELEERLTQALHAPEGGRVALLVADLDGFKPINDSYGHAVGDEVLAAVGRRLRSCVRDNDTVARLGGDEFVILTRITTAREPTELAARIRKALRDPVQTSEGVLTVAASLGVAVAEFGSDASDLLRQADRAMYRVKLAQR